MSDSVVNVGIGDVLSSVKRLVDEDVRNESEFIFVPSAPASKPGKLVLTDALRVNDEVRGDQKAAPLKLTPAIGAKVKQPKPATAGPMRLHSRDIVSEAFQSKDAAAANQASNKPGKRDLAGSLSAKIEALEAAIARTEDQWEPDGQTNDAYSGTKTRAVEWPVEDGSDGHRTTGMSDDIGDEIGQPVPEFIRKPENVADVTSEAPPSDLRNADVDEAVLNEIVTRIVREELQGALGERITRNLRKMVRREISRALAAQEIK